MRYQADAWSLSEDALGERGHATAENAQHDRQHVTGRVSPSLEHLPGYRGAYLLARESDGEVEFLAALRLRVEL
jgi:hypothetical protein